MMLISLWGSREKKRGYVQPEDQIVVGTVMVDDEDFAELSQYRWHLTDTGYAARWYGGRPPRRKRMRLHRQVLGLDPEDKRQVDHLNRDKRDNRKVNLRIVEKDGHNKQNVPKRVGKYRGVYFDKSRGKWVAQAKCGDKRLHRRFNSEDEAGAAALAWRREHMPFAID